MKVSTGTRAFDILLDGGLETDSITMVYGPAASGKTNLCLHCALSVTDSKKVIYIDTEGGFSIERLKQLQGFSNEKAEKIFFLRPTKFGGQKNAFEKLNDMVDEKVGLIVVDTIANLYRVEAGRAENKFRINKELGSQLAILAEIVRKKNIPVLITNQVYSRMDAEDVKMVGGDFIKYQSKCIIEIQKLRGARRAAILKKHRSLPEKQVLFEITEEGFSYLS